MKKNKFNQFWKSWHFIYIMISFSYMAILALNYCKDPVYIHIPSSEEIREKKEFDISDIKEIELEDGELVSIYES